MSGRFESPKMTCVTLQNCLTLGVHLKVHAKLGWVWDEPCKFFGILVGGWGEGSQIVIGRSHDRRIGNPKPAELYANRGMVAEIHAKLG